MFYSFDTRISSFCHNINNLKQNKTKKIIIQSRAPQRTVFENWLREDDFVVGRPAGHRGRNRGKDRMILAGRHHMVMIGDRGERRIVRRRHHVHVVTDRKRRVQTGGAPTVR